MCGSMVAIDCRQRLVGRQQHDDVGRRRRLDQRGGRDAVGLGLCRAGRTVAQADDDIDAAVLEVQRLGSALVAIADDRDALAVERRGIDVGVALGVHRGLASLPRASSASARSTASPSSGSRNRGQSGGRLVRKPGILALGIVAASPAGPPAIAWSQVISPRRWRAKLGDADRPHHRQVGSSLRASSASTSASAPCSTICANRRSQRS